MNYAITNEYEIGGIIVTGTKYLDPDILISLSGLSVGDKISIPGDIVSNTVKSLWGQGLFTDVEIFATKIVGSTIFLEIHLKERPRLSRFSITGVKKSDADDLRDKIKLIKGRVVTENTKINTARIIKDFYYEKGFLNARVSIAEKPDSVLVNSVLLDIDIQKGRKVKVERIIIDDNVSLSDARIRKAMKETKEKARFSLAEILNRNNIKEFRKLKENQRHSLQALSPTRWAEYVSNYSHLNFISGSKFISKEYENDKRNILALYNENGYKDAQIVYDTLLSGRNNNIIVKLKIDEGRRYYFRNITWKGNSKYSADTLSLILNIRKGEIYNKTLLDEKLFMSQSGNDISSIYMDDGYLFFQVTPVEVAIDGDSVDIEVRIYEGPQATINAVRIYGNTKTNEKVIRREIRTLPGEKFSRSDLIRSQREIINLGYFDPEQMQVIPVPNPEKGTVDIEYHVVEKPSDQFELSAGWGGRGRGIVGSVGVNFTNFSLRNIVRGDTWSPLPSGDGQTLSLRIQTNGKAYQSYNFSFTEPWLGGRKPNSFSVSYFHTRFADLDAENNIQSRLISNGATVGFGTRLKFPDNYFTGQIILGFENYILQDWSSNDFLFSNGTANNFSIGFTLARNSINQPIYPTAGAAIQLSLQLTPPYSLLNDKDYTALSNDEKYRWVEYHKWKIRIEWFSALTRNKSPLVLRVAAKFGFLGFYNKDIGYSPFERFELGGDGISNFNLTGRDIIALRGYDVLTPSSAAPFFSKVTAEIRFPFTTSQSATIWAHTFLEAGNFWNSITEYDPFNLNRSAGIGVRIFLPIFGMLGFDYGIGFDKDLGSAQSFGDYIGKYGRFSIVLSMEPE